MTGRHLGLTDDEAEDIRRWIGKKKESWQFPLSVAERSLGASRFVAPDVMQQAHARHNGSDLIPRLGEISPAHVTIMSRILPHRYDLQRVVAQNISAHGLQNKQVIQLCESLAHEPSLPSYYAQPLPFILNRAQSRDLFDRALSEAETLLRNNKRPEENGVENTERVKKSPPATRVDLSAEENDELGRLVDSHIPTLARILRRLGVPRYHASDIIGDVIASMYEEIAKGRLVYKSSEQIYAWLHTAVRWSGIDWYMRYYREKFIDEVVSEMRGLVGSYTEGWIDIYEYNTSRDYLEQLLPYLNELERTVTVLAILHGLSMEQIGKLLGRTESAAKGIFSRARKKIVSCYKEYGAECTG